MLIQNGQASRRFVNAPPPERPMTSGQTVTTVPAGKNDQDDRYRPRSRVIYRRGKETDPHIVTSKQFAALAGSGHSGNDPFASFILFFFLSLRSHFA